MWLRFSARNRHLCSMNQCTVTQTAAWRQTKASRQAKDRFLSTIRVSGKEWDQKETGSRDRFLLFGEVRKLDATNIS